MQKCFTLSAMNSLCSLSKKERQEEIDNNSNNEIKRQAEKRKEYLLKKINCIEFHCNCLVRDIYQNADK